MPYQSLTERNSNDPKTQANINAASKFCNLGIVTSQKWTSTHIKCKNSTVEVYSSSSDAEPVFIIELTKDHCTSVIKKKDYSQDPSKIANMYCFNLLEKYPLLNVSSKLLKIGCYNESDAIKLAEAIYYSRARLL